MIAILVTMVGLIGCSESKEESSADVQKKDTQMSTETAKKSEDMIEESKEKADALKADAAEAYDETKKDVTDTIDEVKQDVTDAIDETKVKAETEKEAAAKKIKDACIKAKKALGESTDDC